MDSCANFRFRFFDRGQDIWIRAATADVPAHPFADLVVAIGVSFFYASHRRANLSGCAVAALKSVMLDECSLDGVQFFAMGEPFDGRDLVAFMRDSQTEAGIDAAIVHQHRARTALAMVASFLRAGEMQ